jgi:hypothetical protein
LISAAELEAICERLLEEGVPPGVVARVFDLDPDLIKLAQSKVRVRRYGTEDLSEYLEQIQWDTLDRVREIIAKGSPADQVKFAGALLGKQMAVAARRTPEKQRETTDRVLAMFENMRSGEAKSDDAQSRFVAVTRATDDQDEDGQAP